MAEALIAALDESGDARPAPENECSDKESGARLGLGGAGEKNGGPSEPEAVLRGRLSEIRPKFSASPYFLRTTTARDRYGPHARHNLVVEAGTGGRGRSALPTGGDTAMHEPGASPRERPPFGRRLMGHSNIARRPDTCTCGTPTSALPSTGRSQKTEPGHCSDTFRLRPPRCPRGSRQPPWRARSSCCAAPGRGAVTIG